VFCENKQLSLYRTKCFLNPRGIVFTAWYELKIYLYKYALVELRWTLSWFSVLVAGLLPLRLRFDLGVKPHPIYDG
jgi:hypothetical protein